MSWIRSDAREVAERFIGETAELDGRALGSGIDGIVFLTTVQTAIKVYRAARLYRQELAAYKRLWEHRVRSVCGHSVPRLIRWDDELMVIEMSCVEPPYVLDFAKCKLDFKPEFEEGTLELWHEQVQEMFGDHWEAALDIHYELWRRYGIYYDDIKPANISFAEPSPGE